MTWIIARQENLAVVAFADAPVMREMNALTAHDVIFCFQIFVWLVCCNKETCINVLLYDYRIAECIHILIKLL
jgi:hypothetical protein